ncbi:conserved hypothetical protein [Methylocella silvestris BL2]|uniref:Uncharacterized protein n=1 Tax=Methylocella silvestris (strain DSM 15510 / CIP 108128 / LMG 27833 / NCIMB 13906 / BL2) TaxID=395965 RepID=B8ESN5_METSB|nr:hypothetical protein [Methylocella silvestris]ACK50370.1 conserved hypothetical protein [Methylocella silvestris BL2]
MRQEFSSRRALCLAFVLLIGAPLPAPAAPATIDLPGADVYPESITSKSDGTLFVGSVAKGGVMRIPQEAGQAESFIEPGAFGSRSIFGVLADDASNTLWVCSNDASMLNTPGPSKVEGSFLKGFDLTTGAPKTSARLPGEHTLCNDIAIGPGGAVYVTNTFAPEILKLDRARDRLEVWLRDSLFEPPKNGGGLDGIAFDGDGNLYVNTFTPGELFRIDVKGGAPAKITRLQTSRPLTTPDALRRLDQSHFLMIEGDGKLDRVTVSGDSARIETIADGFGAPTSVTQVGETAFVTDGQLPGLFSGSGESPRLPFRLYAAPLSPRAD